MYKGNTVHFDLLPSGEDLNHNPNLQLQSAGFANHSLPQPDKFADVSPPQSSNVSDRRKRQGETKYHIVFSTGCSIFQDWQSYAFFYHVLQSGQEGQVTRIVSGCRTQQKKDLNRIFEAEIASMAPGRFHLHHTRDYSFMKRRVYFKYFNKPFGMKHWMENALGYPQGEHDDDIIILLDPDQIIKRPFTDEFEVNSEAWKTKPRSLRVDHGSPFAQLYGYKNDWKSQINFSKIFPNSSTPITKLKKYEVDDFYHGMGPPYIATAKDMYSIVKVWSEVVVRVHDQYPYLLAEMYAYNIAAAHLGLRHTLSKSFMLSEVRAYRTEAWRKLVDPIRANRACANDLPQESYPHVIHYCQKYGVGKWYFNKYRFKEGLMSCERPLLNEPPHNITDMYTSAIYPENRTVVLLPMKRRKQEAFMLCNILRDVNQAIVHYKQHHCNESANYDYTFTFFANMTWEGQ